MIQYPESFYKTTGAYACYFFCLVKIAEEYTGFDYDINTVIQLCSCHRNAMGKQWITLNWDNLDDPANFDVNSPTDILELLTGKKWTCERIDSPKYTAKKGDYIVEHWYNEKTHLGHFRLKSFDPLQNSQTVKNGKIDGYRVFRVIA